MDDEELPKEFRHFRSRIMYIEDKSKGLEGPARVGRVFFSKTGKTLYYRGRKFLAFGFLAIILSAVLDWAEAKSGFPPAFLGWGLLTLTIAAVAVMPLSGGWLLFVRSIDLVRAA